MNLPDASNAETRETRIPENPLPSRNGEELVSRAEIAKLAMMMSCSSRYSNKNHFELRPDIAVCLADVFPSGS